MSDYLPPLKPYPVRYLDRSATEPEIIRWVAGHMEDPAPDAAECPDPFAWTLLKQCREDQARLAWFIEKLWVKLIPSRSQIDTDATSSFDGQVQLDTIERIQSMRADLEAKTDAPAFATAEEDDSW